MKKLSLFDRVWLILLSVMIVAFGVLTGVARRQEGIRFGDSLLRLTEKTAEQTVYAGNVSGEKMTVTVVPKGENRTEVTFQIGDVLRDVCLVEQGLPFTASPEDPLVLTGTADPEGLRITKNGELLFEGGYDADTEYGWYDQNGEWSPMISAELTFPIDHINWAEYEAKPATVMGFVGEVELEARGEWLLYFLGVLLTLAAMADLYYAEELFRWRARWYVKNPEPTEYYFTENRVASVIVTILAFSMYMMGVRTFP